MSRSCRAHPLGALCEGMSRTVVLLVSAFATAVALGTVGDPALGRGEYKQVPVIDLDVEPGSKSPATLPTSPNGPPRIVPPPIVVVTASPSRPPPAPAPPADDDPQDDQPGDDQPGGSGDDD